MMPVTHYEWWGGRLRRVICGNALQDTSGRAAVTAGTTTF